MIGRYSRGWLEEASKQRRKQIHLAQAAARHTCSQVLNRLNQYNSPSSLSILYFTSAVAIAIVRATHRHTLFEISAVHPVYAARLPAPGLQVGPRDGRMGTNCWVHPLIEMAVPLLGSQAHAHGSTRVSPKRLLLEDCDALVHRM